MDHHLEAMRSELYFLSSTECLVCLEALVSAPLSTARIHDAGRFLNEIIQRDEMDPPDRLVYGVLQGLAYLQDGLGLEQFLGMILNHHLELSPKYVEVLLRHYSKNGPMESAEKLLDYAISKGVETSVYFYSLLVDGYGNTKQPWKCFEVLKAAERQGHQITIHLLSRIVRAFGNAKDLKGIEMVTELVERRKFPKSPDYFNSLLNAYKHTGQLKKGTPPNC